MDETLKELLELQRENNALLKECVSILRKLQDPEYIMEENIFDFIMGVTANLVASDIIKNKK